MKRSSARMVENAIMESVITKLANAFVKVGGRENRVRKKPVLGPL